MQNDILTNMVNTLSNAMKGGLSSKESRQACIDTPATMQLNLIYVGLSVLTGALSSYLMPQYGYSIMEIVVYNIISALAFYFVLSYGLFSWTEKATPQKEYSLETSQKIIAQGALIIALGNIGGIVFGLAGLGFGWLVTFILAIIYILFVCKTFADVTTSGAWGIFGRIIVIAIVYGVILGIVATALGFGGRGELEYNIDGQMISEDQLLENTQKMMLEGIQNAMENEDMSEEEKEKMQEFMKEVEGIDPQELGDTMKVFEKLEEQ